MSYGVSLRGNAGPALPAMKAPERRYAGEMA